MKIKPWLLLALALGAVAQAALAEDGWQPVAAAQGKYRLFLDAQTFKREGEVVNARFRYAYAEKQVFPFLNKPYDSLERLYYFQCAERKVVVAVSNYYFGKALTHTINASAGAPFGGASAYEPQPVSAGTVEDEALAYACRYKPVKK